jgi:hypothetical protein
MTNAKLEGVSEWRPRWPSAREGLRAAVRALDGEIRSGNKYQQGVSV